MPTDADGDSQMASSPESGNASEPSQGGSRTPTNNLKSQFTAPSELSPPDSQPSKVPGPRGFVGATTSATDAQRPGASWMNKRAQEEYDWAMGYVVDKDFSLKEFGDPFDDRDMEGRGQ